MSGIMAHARTLLQAVRGRFGIGRADAPEAAPGQEGYRAFTTRHDEIVAAADLPKRLPALEPAAQAGLEEAYRLFETGFQPERMILSQEVGRLVGRLVAELTGEQRRRTVVSFLVDHSGSMRGLRILSALLAIEAAVDGLHNAGIDTEILGFTTTSWQGGKSRRDWIRAGRPANPGRLCDLRHIVYAGAGDPPFPGCTRFMLRRDLLCENVNGEALEWAASRLDPGRHDRRIILMLSDGASVDDSTLLANDDGSLLMRHLQETLRRLDAEGIVVGVLLIGGETWLDPPLAARGSDPQGCALGLLSLIGRILLPPQEASADGAVKDAPGPGTASSGG